MKKYLLAVSLLSIPTNFLGDQQGPLIIQQPHAHDHDDEKLAAAFALLMLNGATAITAKDRDAQINAAAAVAATIVSMFQLIRSAHADVLRCADHDIEHLEKTLKKILNNPEFFENLTPAPQAAHE